MVNKEAYPSFPVPDSAETTVGGFPIFRDSQLLNPERLNDAEVLKRGTEYIMKMEADNHGFLALEHPLSQYMQQQLDIIKNPAVPDTRVLISLNNDIDAYALADGTIVVSIGLLNTLPHKEWYPLVLLHENPHFERSHLIKETSDWYGPGAWWQGTSSQVERFFSQVGQRRLFEYEADFLTLFKAQKLKVDSLAFNKFLRHLYNHAQQLAGNSKNQSVDFEHGNILERELNLYWAHSFLDFDTSQTPLITSPAPSEWQLEAPPSKLAQLEAAPDYASWLVHFESATPFLRVCFLSEKTKAIKNLYHQFDSLTKKENRPPLAEAQLIFQDLLTKLGFVLTYLNDHLKRENHLSDDETRQLKYLLLSELGTREAQSNFGTKWFKEAITTLTVQLEMPEAVGLVNEFIDIRPEDYTLSTLDKLETWHRTGVWYEKVGMRPSDSYETSLLGDSYNLPRIYLESLDFNVENPTQHFITQLKFTFDQAQNFLPSWSIEDQKSWAREVCDCSLFYFSKQRVKANIDPDQHLQEVITISRWLQDQGFLDTMSTGSFFNDRARGVLGLSFSDPHPLLDNFADRLTAALSDYRPETAQGIALLNQAQVLELVTQQPQAFFRDLAALQIHDKLQGKTQFFLDLISNNFDQLPTFFHEAVDQYQKNRSLDFYGLSDHTDFDKKFDQLDPEIQTLYHRALFAIEVLAIVTSRATVTERLEVLDELFEIVKNQAKFNQLPLELIEWLTRKVSREHLVAYTYFGERSVRDIYPLPSPEDHDLNEASYDEAIHLGDQIQASSWVQYLTSRFQQHTQTGGLKIKALTSNHYREFLSSEVYMILNWHLSANETSLALQLPFDTDVYQAYLDLDFSSSSPHLILEAYQVLEKNIYLKPTEKKLMVAWQKAILLHPDLDLGAAMGFLKSEIQAGRLTADNLKEFIQIRLNKYQDYQNFSTELVDIFDQLAKDKGTVGTVAVIEQLVDLYSDRLDLIELFEAMLTSRQDDTLLREKLAPLYWQLNLDSLVTERFANYDLEWNEQKVKVSGLNADRFATFDSFLKSFYGLSESQKQILLRKIFLSRSGLLLNKDFSEPLTRILLEHIQTDPVLTPWLGKIILAALRTVDPVLLFTALSDALLPLTLQPPLKAGDNSTAALAVQDFIPKAHTLTISDKFKDYSAAQLKQVLDINETGNSINASLIELHQKLLTHLQHQLDTSLVEQFELTPNPTALELVIKFAEPLAPLGPAFLQVFDQINRLGDEYQGLLNAHDNNEGQTKFSAFFTLETLAQTNPEIKTFLETSLVSLDEKLGSGKLATTYACSYRDQHGEIKRGALKIMNPNAERFLLEINDQIQAVITELKATDLDELAVYQQAERILNIVNNWTRDEIHDSSYERFNQIFADIVTGPTAQGINLSTTEKLSPHTKKVKLNSLVEGAQILGRAVAEGDLDRRRQLALSHAELILKTLHSPISLDGQSISIVLSDPSAGNSLAKNNDLIVIDEQYSLLSEADKEFLDIAFKAKPSLDDLQQVINYFLAQPENAHLPTQTGFKLQKALVEKLFKSQLNQLWNKTKNLMNGHQNQTADQAISQVMFDVFDQIGVTIPQRIRVFFLKTVEQSNKLLHQAQLEQDFAILYRTARKSRSQ